jgi:fluoroquinolone transport system permease protein
MRLLAALRLDVALQARNQLYAISVAMSVFAAAALAWLSPPERVGTTVPMAVLFIVGGSTLLYVVTMIILEKADGTLSAVSVSPLRPWEYLAAKVATLTGIAALEGFLVVFGALWWLSRSAPIPWPGPLFAVGLVALAAMHVLVGIVLVVRYDRLLECLVPMSAIATVLQLPAFYVVGALDSPVLLTIPSAAPTLLIQASLEDLPPWKWAYALGLTAVTLVVLWGWALRAFEAHVVRKSGG